MYLYINGKLSTPREVINLIISDLPQYLQKALPSMNIVRFVKKIKSFDGVSDEYWEKNLGEIPRDILTKNKISIN